MLNKAKKLGHLVCVAGRLLYREGLSGVLNKIAHWRQHRAAQPRIDVEYGTETLSWVQVEHLAASGPNVSYASGYGPSPVFDAERILRQLPIALSENVFVDLGCGKGLVLMLAAQLGFKRVIGVEFGRNLYEVALANLEKFQQRNAGRSPIEMVFGDAAEFVFPVNSLVLYLYHPFGPEVIGKVLDHLRASLSECSRSCWIVYVNPVHHRVFEDCDFLVTHTAEIGRKSGEPYALYKHLPGPEKTLHAGGL
jgi:predicted RNA methylase